MKVIDLLNKIANNEEVPTKIKYGDCIYYLSKYHKDYVSDLSKNVIDTNTYFITELVGMNNLNAEIEIIEEKPKKIGYVQHSSNDSQNVKKIKSKIDELVDVVNYLLEKESDK